MYVLCVCIYIYICIYRQIGIHQTHGRGGACTASTWLSILVSVPEMRCNLFVFPRIRGFSEFPSKSCLYDWTAIGHMLAKRNSP